MDRMLTEMRRSGCGIALAFFAVGCGKQAPTAWRELAPPQAPLQNATGRLLQTASFAVSTTPPAAGGAAPASPAREGESRPEHRIGLNRSALGREFLLRANLISGGLSPSFQGLKTRVVSFREYGDELVMLEANAGLGLYEDLPQELILAHFPIRERQGEALYFDFNAGMRTLYTMPDMYATNESSAAAGIAFSERYQGTRIEQAFLKRAELRVASEELLIDQAAQLVQGDSRLPVEVRYHLMPYQPQADFTPRLSPVKKDAGYFEVTPTFDHQQNKQLVYAAKFNHQKPIVFTISSNTPADFRTSIREGVLYWNKAFGQELLQVVDGPQGLTAPSYDANIIQWVDWQMDGGYLAYADAQMDPRTGQVLNAQVFMTSSFVAYGRKQAEAMLERLHPSQEPTAGADALSQLAANTLQAAFDQAVSPLAPKAARSLPSLRGFQQQPLCESAVPASYQAGLQQLVGQGASDAAFLRISQDLVRTTIAHEVGHVLGLRHNFAGSHAANYDASTRPQHIAAYLHRGEVAPELVVTSSVMDYFPFEELGIIGQQIKEQAGAFAHDRLAVAALYGQLDLSKLSAPRPAFCTDHQVGLYVDCDRHIFGASPLAYAKTAGQEAWAQMPRLAAQYFVQHVKSPRPGSLQRDLNTMALSSSQLAILPLLPRIKALVTLLPGRRALSVDQHAAVVSEVNAQDLSNAYATIVQAEVEKLGGWAAILDTKPQDFVTQAQAEVARLLASPAYRQGSGLGGAYEFSDDEIEQATQAAGNFFRSVEAAYHKLEVVQLASLPKLATLRAQRLNGEGPVLVSEQFGRYLAQKSADTLLAQDAAPAANETLKIPATATVEGLRRVVTLQLLMQEQSERFEVDLPALPDDKQVLAAEELNALASAALNAYLDALMRQPAVQASLAQIDFASIARQLAPASSPDNQGGSQTSAAVAEISAGNPSWLQAGLGAANTATSLPQAFNRLTLASDEELLAGPMNDASEELEAEESPIAPAPPTADPAPADEAAEAMIKANLSVNARLPVSLPRFHQEYTERLLATNLLDSKRGPNLNFVMQERAQVRRFFTRQVLQALRQKDVSQISLEDQNPSVGLWLQENLSLIKAMSPTAF